VNPASTQRRVLILSAGAGTGHIKAALALQKVCEADPRIGEIRNVDSLEFTNKLFRDFYSKLYITLIREAPSLLGWMYQATDEPWKTNRMRLMLDRMHTRPLEKMIQEFDPDLTICTHFLPAEIMSHLISVGRLRAQLSIVVTDLDLHAMWLSHVFHRYFVALDETKCHLEMLGFPPDRITVSGIPVDPDFAKPLNRREARHRLGVEGPAPLLLVSAGALATGPVEQIVQVLHGMKTKCCVVVICGRSETLLARTQERVDQMSPGKVNFQVIGYTEQMALWMGAADIFVGKPGGLTTAEALARELPFCIYSPIPGQEERNSDHLLEKGIAIKCNELTTLAYKLDALLNDPVRLRQMRIQARRYAKPHAARTVVETLLSEIPRRAIHLEKKNPPEHPQSPR
jgi:processive 1,2-diacylglycerol beta-glucosyltransferase